MDFEDLFELLEAVRTYELRPGESLIPTNSVTGTVIGYATADGDGPSVTWNIETKKAKASAEARGTKEALRIRQMIPSYMGRRELLIELRNGSLEYGIARPPPPVALPEEIPPKGPKQLLIPGL